MSAGDNLKTDDFILASKAGRKNVTDRNGTSETLDETEKKMILKALEECGGNLSRTSEKLGITRATLYRKIERHGIQTD